VPTPEYRYRHALLEDIVHAVVETSGDIHAKELAKN
jgi:hypothetical protein